MKSNLLQIPLARWWWTKKLTYFVYFVREFTGVVIATYIFYLLYLYAKYDPGYFKELHLFRPFTWIALIFALIHTVTWLYVTARIVPVRVGRVQIPQLILFIMLMGVWCGISMLLLLYFYDPIIYTL